MTPTRNPLCIALLALFLAPAALGQSDHWVGTWASAQVSAVNKTDDFAKDTTLRQIVHVSLGGSSVRVVLTNEFGTEALNVAGAQIAPGGSDGVIQPPNSFPLTFSGLPGISIPPGAVAVSDPVSLKLPALSDLAISIFLPAQVITTITTHTFADETNYEAANDQVAAGQLADARPLTSWRFLKAVEVEAPASSGAIVAFGDSITDGTGSRKDANTRWPDFLARRLQGDKKTSGLGILNEGIGGNRVLHDGAGPSALARFDRDVIDQAGVRYVILLESINDIGHLHRAPTPTDLVITSDELIAALKQLIIRAHTHGIRIIGATLTPYGGAVYATPEGETIRQAVNAFIRKPGNFDGVIDFEAVTKDPANPSAFLPAYDHGDHLHPSDEGYKAMGDSINLKLFER